GTAQLFRYRGDLGSVSGGALYSRCGGIWRLFQNFGSVVQINLRERSLQWNQSPFSSTSARSKFAGSGKRGENYAPASGGSASLAPAYAITAAANFCRGS